MLLHSGLKFGLYSSAGTNTCQGRPGSLGYETNDANTYASWGVDYLKYDNVTVNSNWHCVTKSALYMDSHTGVCLFVLVLVCLLHLQCHNEGIAPEIRCT